MNADEPKTGSRFVSPTMQPIVMIGIALVFFYFILWRPEKKRRQALEAKRNSIAKGDKVTAMGIVGTVDEIRETTVVLIVESGKIEILKAAVTDTFKAPEANKDAK